MLKSQTTSAIDSEHCVEDSYIIQSKFVFDDDVRSLYSLDTRSQKDADIINDYEIKSDGLIREDDWSPK